MAPAPEAASAAAPAPGPLGGVFVDEGAVEFTFSNQPCADGLNVCKNDCDAKFPNNATAPPPISFSAK